MSYLPHKIEASKHRLLSLVLGALAAWFLVLLAAWFFHAILNLAAGA